jgi:hypothetical protein
LGAPVRKKFATRTGCAVAVKAYVQTSHSHCLSPYFLMFLMFLVFLLFLLLLPLFLGASVAPLGY